MGVNRRGFIGALLASATLDPDRLIWEPGKRLISIPKPASVTTQLHAMYDIYADSYYLRLRQVTPSDIWECTAEISAEIFQAGVSHPTDSPTFPNAKVQQLAIQPMANVLRERSGYRVPVVPIQYH